MPDADPKHYVRGQYDGLPLGAGREPSGSQTETFVALSLEIDNWRWSGVPFFIRAGKSLADTGHGGPRHLQAPAAPDLRPQFESRTPTSSFCGSIPIRGRTWSCRPRRPGAQTHEDGGPVDDLRRGARRAARALRASAGRCASRAMRACSPARTAWRKPGGSCSHCWTRRLRSRPTARARGDRPRPNSCWRDSLAGVDPGSSRIPVAERGHRPRGRPHSALGGLAPSTDSLWDSDSRPRPLLVRLHLLCK